MVAEPRIRPIYLTKVDLEDAYMRLWVRVKDTPATAFITPNKNRGDEKFVGFHLSLQMGFRNSAPF